MRKEDFAEVLGDINENYVKEAETSKMTRKPALVKWGAMAACLCLMVVGATVISQHGFNGPDAGEGGIHVDGDIAGSYSVAVYPASEKLDDVASADVVSLTESEAMSHLLAEYLPAQLPEGFHYGRGSVYNTVMKDGTQYNMLLVEYITGTIPEQQFSDEGGEIVPTSGILGDFFTVRVWNFEPDIKADITPIEEVTAALIEGNEAVYIHSGECYIGVFMETAEPTDILEVIKNI